jgi:UDP-N-acetylglucosamine--N-acetylmuramyl-(pentapeptide) pyrophosphoryl-undecaprenol N-acetylglucosamine transferase
MKVLIAAAQTGGHINPGIAIANKIKQENPNAEIVFIGTTRGLENDLVPRAGYELITIEAYGITRKISFQNLINICKTLIGFKKAKKIVKKLSPDIIIGTGGFICGPVFAAGIKYKIPTILHESNAFPGMAVKLLAKKVNTILVGFNQTKEKLPKLSNVIVTGTPTKLRKINISRRKKRTNKKILWNKQQFTYNINLWR